MMSLGQDIERKDTLMASRSKSKGPDLVSKELRDVKVGDVVLLCGEAREIVTIEPHDLDAYLKIATLDEGVFVRSIFGKVVVLSV